MNPSNILYYANTMMPKYIDDLSDPEWEAAGVCGWWSVKQIMAHLASFEHLLSEVIHTVEGDELGPCMRSFAKSGQDFNDVQVEKRRFVSHFDVLSEYETQVKRNGSLIESLPQVMCHRPGILPWYGMEYSLDDFIVYTFYGHKREHDAQIGVYRDKIGR